MSIVASVMGLLVLAIRKVKFIPHRVSVFLWVIPFLRMCIPFGINSPYSLMTLISRFTTKTVTVLQPADDLTLSMTNAIMAANSYFPITYKVNMLRRVFEIAGFIWLIGTLAIIIALAILYMATKREIKDSRLLDPNVYLSEKLKVFLADLELACDEKAVSKYTDEERKEYARTLLNCVQNKNVFVSAFGGAKVRTRIENVLSYKQMTLVSSVGFALLIIAIIYTLLTNAG